MLMPRGHDPSLQFSHLSFKSWDKYKDYGQAWCPWPSDQTVDLCKCLGENDDYLASAFVLAIMPKFEI